MKGLVRLDPAVLDGREYLALSWVRETLTRREGPSAEIARGFEGEFGDRERSCIAAAAEAMHFFNLAVSTLRRLWGLLSSGGEEEPEACPLER